MNDKLSAFLDGDLDEPASNRLLDAMRRDSSLASTWEAYCTIGDAIRGEQSGSSDFTARVMACLEDEPTVLAPRALPARDGRAAWARALMPIAASVMGVAVVGWLALSQGTQPETSVPMLAVSPSVAQAGGQTVGAPARSADGRSDGHLEYVFVHQAMSAGGPMPGGVHYVRTVSDARGELRR